MEKIDKGQKKIIAYEAKFSCAADLQIKHMRNFDRKIVVDR